MGADRSFPHMLPAPRCSRDILVQTRWIVGEVAELVMTPAKSMPLTGFPLIQSGTGPATELWLCKF